eukprot:901921-Pyramimonas_sp.AAC.1
MYTTYNYTCTYLRGRQFSTAAQFPKARAGHTRVLGPFWGPRSGCTRTHKNNVHPGDTSKWATKHKHLDHVSVAARQP